MKQWEQGRTTPQASNREALKRIAAMGQAKGDAGVGSRKRPAAVRAPAAKTELSPERILDIRKKAGLTQIEMAKALGVSVNSVSNWETGSTGPHAKSLERLLAMRE